MVYDLTRENQIYDGNIEIDGEDLPGVTKFKCNGFMSADDNRLLRELKTNLHSLDDRERRPASLVLTI